MFTTTTLSRVSLNRRLLSVIPSVPCCLTLALSLPGRLERSAEGAGVPQGAGPRPPQACPHDLLVRAAVPAGAGVPAQPVRRGAGEDGPGATTLAHRDTGNESQRDYRQRELIYD